MCTVSSDYKLPLFENRASEGASVAIRLQFLVRRSTPDLDCIMHLMTFRQSARNKHRGQSSGIKLFLKWWIEENRNRVLVLTVKVGICTRKDKGKLVGRTL